MIRLSLNGNGGHALTVLCLGSHSDDIEIGCGGALLSLIEQYPNTSFHWVVFSGNQIRQAEAARAAALFTGGTALKRTAWKDFPDGFLPYVGQQVKTWFEELKAEVNPDLIFTHYRHDAHQDHRLISELTWNTFRNHFILEYEIPKYDGDLGSPNVFVPLDAATCEKKVQFVLDAFQSQKVRQWFERDTLYSLLRIRGMECNSPSGYAEGFYCRKLVL